MNLRRALGNIGGVGADCVLWLIRGVAWLLSGTRLGRIIQAVSVPRLRDHRLRTTLTVFGIALGVAVLVAVLIVNGSVVRSMSATVDQLAGKTDLQISGATSGFNEDLLLTVRATAGIASAVPVLQQIVTVRDPQRHGDRLMVLGVDMLDQSDEALRDYESRDLAAIRRDPLAFLNDSQNILISRSVAKRHGYRLHDKISLVTSRGVVDFDIWGFLDDSGVGHAFGGAMAVMYYPAMQVAFERGHNLDHIDIGVRDRTQINAVEARLQHALGTGFIVERPGRKGDRLAKMIGSVRNGLTVSSLIALLVAAFLIHNTMAISVVQRKREIGILRALGCQRREIVKLLTIEGALLGAVGGAVGVAFGVLLSKALLSATSNALNQTHLQLAGARVVIEPYIPLVGFAAGVVTATIACALPARRAAGNRPAETLRTAGLMQPAPNEQRFTRYDLIACGLIASTPILLQLPASGDVPWSAFAAAAALNGATALLMPRVVQLVTAVLRPLIDRLGVEARLAHRNLPRDVGRTAATAGALAVAVGLVISFGTFTHSFVSTMDAWLDETLPGDLFVTQAASMAGASLRDVPMADTLFEPLRQLPEVEGVRRTRITEIPYGGFMVKAESTDIDVFLRHARLFLLEGSVADIATRVRQGEVIASENFSRRFHVHRGDTIPLTTSAGTRTFRVAAVALDYSSDIGSIAFDRATYIATFQDSLVDTYELYLHDHKNAGKVRELINARFATSHDLFVLTNRELRAEVGRTTDELFSLVRVLELVALTVAVLGIVNSQFASVLDRVREIGVIRALGMRRVQVRRLIVSEACLVSLIGAFAGILLGSALGYVLLSHINLVQTGWYFPYTVSIRAIVEVAALTLPAAALAGFYPAREAAKLVITDALEYE